MQEDFSSMGSSVYKNLISHIDVNRSINSIEHFTFNDVNNEPRFNEFLNDINLNNDTIELNLIRNKAYKEAIIISLQSDARENRFLMELVRDEQKTFGGSKLFYMDDSFGKILVVSVSSSMESKLSMVINRLNKINDKVSKLNSRIKKENLETFMKRHHRDKKEAIINIINRNLRV
jgi:hypothetical protein